jgi:hypothetical protein
MPPIYPITFPPLIVLRSENIFVNDPDTCLFAGHPPPENIDSQPDASEDYDRNPDSQNVVETLRFRPRSPF